MVQVYSGDRVLFMILLYDIKNGFKIVSTIQALFDNYLNTQPGLNRLANSLDYPLFDNHF